MNSPKLAVADGSVRVCPKCGYRAHADRCFICIDETRLAIEIPCPDCYGGHFKPCQWCGDSGVALWVPTNAHRDRPAGTEETR